MPCVRLVVLFLVCLPQCLILTAAFSTNPRNARICSRQRRLLVTVSDDEIHDPEMVNEDDANVVAQDPCIQTKGSHLIFPGGGIFFYWQAGAVTYLREQGYDMSRITASGASAGALTATLMVTNVDFIGATELALQMADDAGVWDRSRGLQGIWGPIVEDWLDQLLPEDAAELANHRLSLLVTPIPWLGKVKVSTFRDRRDLIQCNMASVHLPWFLDGRLTANFRDIPHIDGSFLAKAPDYLPTRRPSSIHRIDWNRDPVLKDGGYFDFVKVISKQDIWNIFEQGKKHAQIMEERGRFKRLPKL